MDVIATKPKKLGERVIRIFMVFDQQHPHGFARGRHRLYRGVACAWPRFGERKNRSEGCALTGAGAGRGQFAVVRLDQRFADCQTKAESAELRAIALLEGIEN